MSWNATIILKLGRVSNLPTVWSNTLAGVILAGTNPVNANLITLFIAMTMAYIGGMFLNDAFDRKIDAHERPERPIPSGQIPAAEVFAAGFTLLVGAVFFTALTAYGWNGNVLTASTVSMLLCITIIAYNVWHKNNPASPFLMGMCRMLVYLSAGFAATPNPNIVLYVGAFVLLAYLIGLTYVAKQENIDKVKNLWPVAFIAVPAFFGLNAAISQIQVWPVLILFLAWTFFCVHLVKRRNKGDIPKAVVSMIAGIALVDGMLIASTSFIASTSGFTITSIAVGAFLLTLVLQRYIAGT